LEAHGERAEDKLDKEFSQWLVKFARAVDKNEIRAVLEDGTVKWHPVGQGLKGDALILDGTHGERTARLLGWIGKCYETIPCFGA
jgi:hypothetical protein